MSNDPLAAHSGIVEGRAERNRTDDEVRLAEYGALERRSQNDSVVGYALVGAILVAALALLSTTATQLVFNKSDAAKAVLLVLAGASIAVLWISYYVLLRFRAAGDIRIARCVQIEEELNMNSFRLFSPWLRGSDDYYLTLGQWLKKNQWNKKEDGQRDFFIVKGKTFVDAFDSKVRVTGLFKWLVIVLSIAWGLLVVIQWTL